jgi:hypothetical protein
MSRRQLSASYNQASFSLSPVDDCACGKNSSSIELEAWSPQQSESPQTLSFQDFIATPITHLRTKQRPDLFAALLYDREEAYRDGTTPITSLSPNPVEHVNLGREHRTGLDRTISTTSSNRPLAPSSIEEQRYASTIGHQRSLGPYIERRERSSEHSMSPTSRPKRKQEAPEEVDSRGKQSKRDSCKSKGRSDENRIRKRPAPRREDIKGRASKTTKTDPKANIGKKIGNSSSAVYTKALPQEVIEISDSDTEVVTLKEESNEQHQLISCPAHAKAPVLAKLSSADKQDKTGMIYRNSDSISDPSISTTPNEDIGKETQDIRQQLRSAQGIVPKLQESIGKKDRDALLPEHISKKRLEQEITSIHNQLHPPQADLAQEAKLVIEHQALQLRYEEESNTHKQEHARMLQDSLRSKAEIESTQERMKTLEKEISQLLAENKSLKAAVASSQGPLVTPLKLSTTPSPEEELREGNVRKMYIKTKRQFDVLHSVANDLATSTRTLDVSNFGDFGKYLRRLRSFLEMEGNANDDSVLAMRALGR